jgi:hypothetical protein
MPVKQRSLFKRMLIDAAGVFLIITGLLLGWLPGPGGIPLFLGGLALLASNHEWAERWLTHLRRHGNNLADILFPNHKWWQLFYDIAAISIILLTLIIFDSITHTFIKGILIWLIVLGVFVLLMNRQRARRLRGLANRIAKN